MRVRLPRFLTAVLLAAAACRAPAARGAPLEIQGFVLAQGVAVEGPPSWLAGGFGRLGAGAEAPGERATAGRGEARVGLEWAATPRLAARLHLRGSLDLDDGRGRAAGVVEAFAQALLPAGESGEVRLRVGTFFLPTSRENVEGLWTSPYTLTLSAWNSWVGEELRPTGLDVAWRSAPGRGASGGLTLFGGNDSSGALLAWRGFAFGDRLAVWGETLPLPPLDSLARGGGFAAQRDAGTRPLYRDLDGRPGWSARGRAQAERGALVQATYLDSRGDRELHRGEYAWRTRFGGLGWELPVGEDWLLAGEWAAGSSGMGRSGRRDQAHVDLDFDAAYLLASWRRGRARLSLRYDRFRIADRDASPGERNDENGEALTVAALVQVRDWLRLGAEVLDLRATRPAAAQSGFDPSTDGRSLRLELRSSF
jgi:hypothetical protein